MMMQSVMSACRESFPCSSRAETLDPKGRFALLLVGSLVVLATALIAPATPAIQAEFGADPRARQLAPLLVTAPALAVALTAPFVGYVLDRWDKRALILAALTGFAMLGAAGAVATNLDWLLWTRIGLGVSVAFLTAGFTTLVGELVPPHDRAVLFARQMGLNAVISISMTLAGGALAELHWRGIFLVYLGAAPIAVLFLRNVPIRLTSALERESPIQARVSRSNPIVVVTIYALVLLATLFAMLAPTRTPFLMQDSFGASAALIAAAIATYTSGMLLASLLVRARPTLSAWTYFALGFLSMAAGFALQAAVPSLFVIISGMGVVGFGFGVIIPNLNTLLLSVASESARGRLSGGFASAMFLGQFLSPLLSQPLVDGHGIASAFYIGAMIMVTVALLCLAGPILDNVDRR